MLQRPVIEVSVVTVFVDRFTLQIGLLAFGAENPPVYTLF
jgi:hypothetical protein